MRIAIALLFLALPARASRYTPTQSGADGNLGQGHAGWHDAFYKRLLRPDTKTSCCNLTDCRPTSGRMVEGHYEVKVNGAWVSAALKQDYSGYCGWRYHVCAPINFKGSSEELYCVVLTPERLDASPVLAAHPPIPPRMRHGNPR